MDEFKQLDLKKREIENRLNELEGVLLKVINCGFETKLWLCHPGFIINKCYRNVLQWIHLY